MPSHTQKNLSVKQPMGSITFTQQGARVKNVAGALSIKLKKKTKGEVIEKKRVLKFHDPTKRIDKLPSTLASYTKKKLKDFYRDIWAEQDELVRTSLVADILLELAKHNVHQVVPDRLAEIVRAFSSIRFPTRWSGFKLKDGYKIAGQVQMQHPTGASGGMWIPKQNKGDGTHAIHTKLDEARAAVAIEALEKALADPKNKTVEAVVKVVLVKAGAFTMSYFTAPALAKNVDATASDAEKTRQTLAREFVKDQLVSLGATRANVPALNLQSLSREFRPDLLNPGEISPRRAAPLLAVNMESKWL